MQKGSITIWVLVFGGVFLIMLSGVLGYLTFQIKENKKYEANNTALHIAEAGINYAKWHLAHTPEDYTFGGIHDYHDLEGGKIGEYNLDITPPSGCNSGIIIKSTGHMEGYNTESREISIVYGKPSLAQFSFLTNDNVWFGDDEELRGPIHSNGGIRMDGTQNSLSTSAKEEYICEFEHGCSIITCPSPCTWSAGSCYCPGVWGSGGGEGNGLWKYPDANFDFDLILQDLSELKTAAQLNGIYLGPSGNYGYHITFKSNGTIDVSRVRRLESAIWGYDGDNWIRESNSIRQESFYQTITLPSDCSPIFVEDNIWIDGYVEGRATIVAARLPDIPGNNAKVVIPDNIIYNSSDSALGIVSQSNILIPFYSPDNLEINAVLLAQKGYVMRYYYAPWPWNPYRTYSRRNSLRTFGSIISNRMWTFSWVKNNGFFDVFDSGYENTDIDYDSNLNYNPPPYFPTTGEYDVVCWEEED